MNSFNIVFNLKVVSPYLVYHLKCVMFFKLIVLYFKLNIPVLYKILYYTRVILGLNRSLAVDGSAYNHQISVFRIFRIQGIATDIYKGIFQSFKRYQCCSAWFSSTVNNTPFATFTTNNCCSGLF